MSVRMALIGLMACGMAMGVACLPPGPVPEAREVEAQKGRDAAKNLHFDDNAERDNIVKRLELTSAPGLLGFVLLLNDAGQPILYTAVKGKVTSGSKRLSSPDYCPSTPGSCSSDEGTYGSSNPYVYFWTENGQYIQWSGDYLYSDKPIRPTIEPLVVRVEGNPEKAQ